MARQSSSTVRSAALRRCALSFEKAFSIGLKSGAIGRQIEEAGSGGLDRPAHAGALVAAEIVHDRDVAGLEFGDEDLIDIGLEPAAVNRPVENHGCRHSCPPQRADEGRGFPVAMRDRGTRPLAFQSAPAQARHVGRGPRLVDEDEPFRVEVELAVEPVLPPLQDVRPLLLARMGGLF